MYPVITISRQVGSEGHTIGAMVAKELGIPLLDKYFISEVAKTMGIQEDKIEKSGEYLSTFEKLMSARFYNGLYLGDEQDKMFQIQKDIILAEVKKGPCVIVGRCADVILQEAGIPCLNVFVRADMEFREANYRKRYPEIGSDIEKILHKRDKGRIGYYHFYTDREWGKIENYDLMLNSGKLGLEKCAELILQAAKGMESLE